MRLRGSLLVVLGLLVLGGYLHASLHAAEGHHEDCPLQLFCGGGGAALEVAPAAVPQPTPALELPLAATAGVLVSRDRAAASARGPPRS